MSTDALIKGLPDLVVLIRRDGTVLDLGGGHGVPGLRPGRDFAGLQLEALWPAPVAQLLRQLTRKAITLRTTAQARFEEGGCAYEARVSAQGPERAICALFAATVPTADDLDSTDERPRPQLDRRGFLRALQGIDVARRAAGEVARRRRAVRRRHLRHRADHRGQGLRADHEHGDPAACRAAGGRRARHSPAGISASSARACSRSCGELGSRGDRGVRRAVCAPVCGEPVAVGRRRVSPHALCGRRQCSARCLLAASCCSITRVPRLRKRAAAASTSVLFFSDTLQLRISRAAGHRPRAARGHREPRHPSALRRAARSRERRLRVAWVSGTCAGMHPLRGEIRPAEFLRVAETTGLATILSRAALAGLREDFAALSAQSGRGRAHLLRRAARSRAARGFRSATSSVSWRTRRARRAPGAAHRGEERSSRAIRPTFARCERRGVQLVVDEVARGMGSLPLLARAPLWGLQLDRAWVTALRNDDVARKVCRAGISLATALGLTPIATGVDDAAAARCASRARLPLRQRRSVCARQHARHNRSARPAQAP